MNTVSDWRIVRALDAWAREGEDLVLRARLSDDSPLEVRATAWTSHVWRIRAGADPRAPAPLLVDREGPGPDWTVEEDAERLLVRTPALGLELRKRPWRLSFVDALGRLVCRENGDDVDVLGRPAAPSLGIGAGPQAGEGLLLGRHEHLYGLGEKFTALDKRGQRVASWTQDALGTTTERAYKNVPFLLSTAGFGVFVNTTRRVDFALGVDSVRAWSFAVAGDSLDYFVILGPEPAAILDRYTRLTGRPGLPPQWSFGLWMSGTGAYRTQVEIEAMARGLHDRDIPCAVIHVEPWWMRPRKYADFVWNDEAFPDPAGLVRRLGEMGYRLSLYEHPYVSVESELFAAGRERGYFARRPDGEVYVIEYGLSRSSRPGERAAGPHDTWNAPVAIVDFTNPAATRWWQELHRPLLALGVAAFKTDFGEDVPADARFADGTTGEEMHNLYPLLYNRAVYEITAEATGEGIVWSRAGWAGSQRYPTCWGGDPACDYDSLAASLRGGLSLGLSGVPFWSHDIGGYHGTPDERLYVRWAQLGLLSPHARAHGETPREPWRYGPRAEEIFRRYAKLRRRLLPYLHAQAIASARTGIPLLRALVLEWPHDPSAWSIEDEFLLGDAFLVAPVLDATDRRRIYFPPGRWIDFWSGTEHDGERWADYDAPLEVLPLFVRAGTTLPMEPEA
ncbi:MAG: TIM-barrel domain-containing protein [Planctomycetota bacterium]